MGIIRLKMYNYGVVTSMIYLRVHYPHDLIMMFSCYLYCSSEEMLYTALFAITMCKLKYAGFPDNFLSYKIILIF